MTALEAVREIIVQEAILPPERVFPTIAHGALRDDSIALAQLGGHYASGIGTPSWPMTAELRLEFRAAAAQTNIDRQQAALRALRKSGILQATEDVSDEFDDDAQVFIRNMTVTVRQRA